MGELKVTVHPEGWLARSADYIMTPLMYLVAGTISERPQEGHLWNKKMLGEEVFKQLDQDKMAHCPGKKEIGSRTLLFLPMMHLPVLGGWRDYVVLAPKEEYRDTGWHIGWHTFDLIGPRKYRRTTCGMRRRILYGPVRMLVATQDTYFFGIAAEGDNRGEQIPIQLIGTGRIGDGGSFAKVPLL